MVIELEGRTIVIKTSDIEAIEMYWDSEVLIANYINLIVAGSNITIDVSAVATLARLKSLFNDVSQIIEAENAN